MPPSCTVVVCTRDRPAELANCLSALTELDYSSYDVLVVDNGSGGADARDLACQWGADYAVEPRQGLSRARNRGARAACTDVVAYLDDDALPERGWLGALAAEFADPAVMAVAGRIRPTRLDTPAELLFELAGGFTPNRARRRVVDGATPDWFGVASFGGIGTGANMAFRRRAFDLWPGFDERLGAGAPLPANEEHHAFARLIERGFRVVYAPGAVVRHPYPSTLEALRQRHARAVAGSAGYLVHCLLDTPTQRRAALRFAARALVRIGGAEPVAPHEPGQRRVGAWPVTLWAAVCGAATYARRRVVGLDRAGTQPLAVDRGGFAPTSGFATGEAAAPADMAGAVRR
jgi:cellulose synthase/poly-beta-1,6-N-acetylglucosamine synthase-like glycosyltransferase